LRDTHNQRPDTWVNTTRAVQIAPQDVAKMFCFNILQAGPLHVHSYTWEGRQAFRMWRF